MKEQPDETVTKEEAMAFLKVCKNGYDKSLGNSNMPMARQFREEMVFWSNYLKKQNEHETEQANDQANDQA